MKWLAVHIGGQKWGVWLVSPRSKYLRNDKGDLLLGLCHFDRCRIYLDKTQGEQQLEDTLLHELLHAALFVSGANRAYNQSLDVEEPVVTTLTPCLHRILKDLGFRFPKAA